MVSRRAVPAALAPAALLIAIRAPAPCGDLRLGRGR
jgi:hypothetical protein